MAADKSDDPGVLGNLPRSRPGHRSDKRRGGAAGGTKAPVAADGTASTAPARKAPARAAAKASAAPARKAQGRAAAGKASPAPARKAPARAAAKGTKPSEAATAKRARPAPRTPVSAPAPAAAERTREPDHRSPDPLTGAVRLAGKVAEAGISTAGGLLRRLTGR